jgi:uncharacterized protein HemX
MKTFLTTLAAIVVAATMIGIGSYVARRINAWENEKQIWVENIKSERQTMTNDAQGDRNEMDRIATYATSIKDQVRIANIRADSLTNLKERQERILAMDREVIELLEHKPFGIPLTAQERKDLEALKGSKGFTP